jgi:hypothetical protein
MGGPTHIVSPGEIEMHQSEAVARAHRPAEGEEPGGTPQVKYRRHGHPCQESKDAIGLVNVQQEVPAEVLGKLRAIQIVRRARIIEIRYSVEPRSSR